MVFWKGAQPLAQQAPSAASTGMDHSEEMLAEVDEPPDDLKSKSFWGPSKLHEGYNKAAPQMAPRRESLLTRQLHSETEHSDEDHMPHPPRALSTQSTWSTTSTSELTSDDGHSMPSPAISPPLPPTHARTALPVSDKPLDKKLKIVGQDEAASQNDTGSEKSIEATLGRKRCIMFACRGKEETKPKPPSPTSAPPEAKSEPETPAEPEQPKRKCTIKFACPTKIKSDTKTAQAGAPKRPVSPPPPPRRTPVKPQDQLKVHRGSDSTVTHGSPQSARRKSPSLTRTSPTPTATATPELQRTQSLSRDSDEETGTEAMRFHEFASSDDEPEEWVQEMTCHRSRLTVTDTLQKENVIRKACEEVEEEAIEEEEEEDEAGDDKDEDDDQDEDQEDQEDDGNVNIALEDEDSEGSDAGFHSDDEEGFAESESDDGEDSDYEWWRPGGSTAATSIEHLDRLTIHAKQDDDPLASSMGSASSHPRSPRSSTTRRLRSPREHRHTPSIPIAARAGDNDLPDSTDFVCGTLDEDRPLEQAYINRKKEIEDAKHKPRPQDIDPSFPTSDPEMDEEDDEDIEDPEESEGEEKLMHGEMEVRDEESTLKRRPSPAPMRRKSTRSPPPAARYHSPPPLKRTSTKNHSPPPTVKYHSPPPLKRTSTKHHSPPPPLKRTSTKHHSPPPPMKHRPSNRSPPPRKLFGGHSPKRARSPAPTAMMTSPPNTRRSSPTRGAAFAKASQGLAARPDLVHTASLPRTGGFLLSRMGEKHFEDREGSDTAGANDVPKRGAIDIVKGLEKKRQRRKEKMWQKMCAKNAAKGEKSYKVKPGKGAERMREVGLELQRYRGKGEHILSV